MTINKGTLRILIIRPSALGDVSRTVPALATLRQTFPDAKIDWLINDTFADAVQNHPALDEVVPFPRKHFATGIRSPRGVSEILTWSRTLGDRCYDLVFDLQGLLRSGLFTWATHARQRVGFANAREMAWLCYNRRHKVDFRLHTVDRMLALLEAEGYDTIQPDMRLYISQESADWLDHWREDLDGTGNYACLAPTAKWRCKCWPIENYIRLARQLLETSLAGDRLVILASPDEQDQLQPISNALDNDPRVVYPQTTVGQLMAIISQTNLLVCNDSAPLHIAVGFDRPIVSIFGPTNPALVGPYRRDETVIQPPGIVLSQNLNYRRHRDDQSLISQVTFDAVWEKVTEQTEDRV